MRSISPDLFAKLMRLPANDRFDLLEFIGATPMEDLDLDELIEQITTQVSDISSYANDAYQ